MHFKKFRQWKAGQSAEITWRDGLNGSDRTYAFVAVPWESRSGYKAIVAGRVTGYFNQKPEDMSVAVKFYPNVEAVGLEVRQLSNLGFRYGVTRGDYVRYNTTLGNLLKLLESLDAKEWATAPLDIKELGKLAQYPTEPGRASSRARHPVDDDFETTTEEEVVVGSDLQLPQGLGETPPEDDDDLDPDNPDKGSDGKVKCTGTNCEVVGHAPESEHSAECQADHENQTASAAEADDQA